MIADLTLLDVVALALFLSLWIGYSVLFHGGFQTGRSVNARMAPVRELWMVRMLEREQRIVDAHLNGSSIATASFFASATIVVIGALIGVLGVADRVHAATSSLSTLVGSASLLALELKLFGLIAMFIYAFFCFTWSIRQFGYFSAIIGAAPTCPPGGADRAMARRMALIRAHAVGQLNAGLRAYYFALAALGWFVHPVLFMATSVLITLVLLHRQLWSPTARLIRDHADHLT